MSAYAGILAMRMDWVAPAPYRDEEARVGLCATLHFHREIQAAARPRPAQNQRWQNEVKTHPAGWLFSRLDQPGARPKKKPEYVSKCKRESLAKQLLLSAQATLAVKGVEVKCQQDENGAHIEAPGHLLAAAENKVCEHDAINGFEIDG